MLDLSWYGDSEVTLRLGGSFHSGRLAVRASQVGTVSPAGGLGAPPPTGCGWRCALLRDPAFDVLLTGSSPLDDLPDVMARLADGTLPALCHTVTYPEEPPCSA